MISEWSESESPSIDFLSLVALGLEGLGSTTWGALVCVTVCRPMLNSNVISPMSSTIILGGLTSKSICMFELFITIYCVFGFRMMIQANGVFKLIGGTTSMEPIDCMVVS